MTFYLLLLKKLKWAFVLVNKIKANKRMNIN